MQNQTLILDLREDDSKWPQKNKDGRQELEIRLGNEHISFEVWPKWIRNGTTANQSCNVLTPWQTAKIGSLVDVTESADPEGLRVFYYLVQDLKALVFSLISLHFKVWRAWLTLLGHFGDRTNGDRNLQIKPI